MTTNLPAELEQALALAQQRANDLVSAVTDLRAAIVDCSDDEFDRLYNQAEAAIKELIAARQECDRLCAELEQIDRANVS